jgi:hypothetical protein
MGLRVFHIVPGREVLELECDDPTHGDEVRIGWFDSGSWSDNLTLAIVAGWGGAKAKTAYGAVPSASAGKQSAHTRKHMLPKLTGAPAVSLLIWRIVS